MRYHFPGYGILGRQSFSFIILNKLPSCLLVSMVSDKKSINLIKVPLYTMSYFCAFDSLILQYTLSSPYLELDFLGFFGCVDLDFSSHLRNFWPLFLQIFYPFLSSWDSSYTYVHVLDCTLQVSEALFILLNLFFSLFLNLNNLNGPILKTANSLLSAQIFHWVPPV